VNNVLPTIEVTHTLARRMLFTYAFREKEGDFGVIKSLVAIYSGKPFFFFLTA